MSKYFGITVLGDSNGIHTDTSDVPDYLRSFVQLGSGNLLLQEHVSPDSLLLKDLPSHSASDQTHLPTGDTSETVLGTQLDVWRHLNSVSHKFKTNLKDLLTNDLRGQDICMP